MIRFFAVFATLFAWQELQEMEAPEPQHATWYASSGRLKLTTTPVKAASSVVCYRETDTTGFFGAGALTSKGDEWLDWGTLNAATCPSPSTSDIVSQFSFGYSTDIRDISAGGPGVSMAIAFYAGSRGTSSDSLANCIYRSCLTGLPATVPPATRSSWILTVVLTGGSEFQLPATDFGFGLQQGNTDHLGLGFSNTGPLLCQAGDGLGGADANGNVDFFSVWSPDAKTDGGFVGNTFQFASSDHAAWYLTLSKADLVQPGSIVSDNPGGCNVSAYTVSGSARLGSEVDILLSHPGGFASSSVLGYAAPTTATLPGGRCLLLDLTSPALLLPVVEPNPTMFTAGVPIDLSLCGQTFYTQAAFFGGGVRPFQLSNRVAYTLGG